MHLCAVDVCSLPMSVGPCRGNFVRWYYDSATGRCRMFTYGGCRGNGNRFESVQQCLGACAQSGQPTSTPTTIRSFARTIVFLSPCLS